MLTRDDFWNLIATTGGSIDEESAEALSTRLALRPAEEIVQFADHLASLLYDLDSPTAAAQLVTDPTAGEDPFELSDDLFLYARCAVVAAGRDAYERVLADPTALAGEWPVFDGEFLITVAPTAYEMATGEEYDHEPPVSYETGSNSGLWESAG